jgi:hypothetical protein
MFDSMIMDGRDIRQADIIMRYDKGTRSNAGFERSGGTESNDICYPLERECCQVCPVIDPVRGDPILVAHQHDEVVTAEQLCIAKRRRYLPLLQWRER